MVPHQHHSESEEGENHELLEDATSPLDFLVLMFHEDLGGENHLEDYNVSSNVQLSIPFLFIAPALLQLECVSIITKQSFPPIFQESPLDSVLRTATKKRGPPSFV